MSDELTFVDTNVLVYAYDRDAGDKHTMAQALLVDLWNGESGALSTQVLQEFYVTVTRKLPKPLSRQKARELVATYSAWPVYRPSVEDVLAASDLEERRRLSFWDALVVIAAQQTGAAVLASEDLQDGSRFSGVTVDNPFSG